MEETERPEIRFFHLRKKHDFFEFQISLSRSDIRRQNIEDVAVL
jgi:hypothetical protein